MTDPIPDLPQDAARGPRRLGLTVVAGLAGAAVGLAAVYGIGGLKRNGTGAADPACTGTVETVRRLQPFARGEVAALTLNANPQRLPDFTFADTDGKPVRLSGFRGRTVLLNLWATWCVPCRKEMPALDALAREIGGDKFEIVAINLDTGDRQKPRRFLSEIGVSRLAYYEDPSTGVFQELKKIGRAPGLPTSLLIDANGCEIGYLAGPADWASADAMALVQAALAR
jgi:thiol-disulfide isomerase/thioredoxin